MTIVTRVVRKLMKHGNSRVLALPPEMREELGIEPSDSLAIYQLQGGLLIVPLKSLAQGRWPQVLETLLRTQD